MGVAYGMQVIATVRDDQSVLVSVESSGVSTDLGVYGPYETAELAQCAAREAVAHVARQVQAQKWEILASEIVARQIISIDMKG